MPDPTTSEIERARELVASVPLGKDWYTGLYVTIAAALAAARQEERECNIKECAQVVNDQFVFVWHKYQGEIKAGYLINAEAALVKAIRALSRPEAIMAESTLNEQIAAVRDAIEFLEETADLALEAHLHEPSVAALKAALASLEAQQWRPLTELPGDQKHGAWVRVDGCAVGALWAEHPRARVTHFMLIPALEEAPPHPGEDK